jgi:hypothetical protein
MLAEATVSAEWAEGVRQRIKDAPSPMKLADVVKGLKPKKIKQDEFARQVVASLEEDVRQGLIFATPSAKNGAIRYWSKDERQALRDRVLELATTPLTLAALRRNAASAAKGCDAKYIDTIIQDLTEDRLLFKHPAGRTYVLSASPPPPPPPPLEQKTHAANVKKAIEACQRLLSKSGVSVNELLAHLRAKLQPISMPLDPSPEPASKQEEKSSPTATSTTDIEELVLKVIENEGVVSIASLRKEMPSEFQGAEFNRTLLRLSEDQRIILCRDDDPLKYSDAEQSEMLKDGDALFTAAMKGN